MEPVVEPNEEAQLVFKRPIPNEFNKDAYNLVAVHKWSKFPRIKVVSDTTADIAIDFMQRCISNNEVSLKLRCNQAQTLRANKFQIFL